MSRSWRRTKGPTNTCRKAPRVRYPSHTTAFESMYRTFVSFFFRPTIEGCAEKHANTFAYTHSILFALFHPFSQISLNYTPVSLLLHQLLFHPAPPEPCLPSLLKQKPFKILLIHNTQTNNFDKPALPYPRPAHISFLLLPSPPCPPISSIHPPFNKLPQPLPPSTPSPTT